MEQANKSNDLTVVAQRLGYVTVVSYRLTNGLKGIFSTKHLRIVYLIYSPMQQSARSALDRNSCSSHSKSETIGAANLVRQLKGGNACLLPRDHCELHLLRRLGAPCSTAQRTSGWGRRRGTVRHSVIQANERSARDRPIAVLEAGEGGRRTPDSLYPCRKTQPSGKVTKLTVLSNLWAGLGFDPRLPISEASTRVDDDSAPVSQPP